MTKITILLTRRSDLSHKEFVNYWMQQHTPLLAQLQSNEVAVSRYVQLLPTNDSIRRRPNGCSGQRRRALGRERR